MDWLGGSRLRALLEQQAQPQPDGSYLVRPFGRIPWIYQMDAATRDRLTRFQMGISRFTIIVLLLGAIAFGRASWMWPWGLVALMVFVFAAAWGGKLVILRRSPRVAKSRWTGPAGPSLWPLFSRRAYLVFFWLSLVMTVVLAAQTRAALRQPNAEFPWFSALLLVTFAACAGFSWVGYRRSPRAQS